MAARMIRLYDRSRTTTDWTCPRRRFWQYEYKGKGVVSNNLSLELYMGSAIHDALAGIAQGVDIDELAVAAQKQMFDILAKDDDFDTITFANEQAALVEGLVRGFYRHVCPRLMASYPIILFVEEEMTFQHDGFTFMAKPDLVLQGTDGRVVYVEYKSTSSKKDTWVNSWDTAVQLHSTIKAVEATKGVKVDEVVVQGLYKGYSSYNKQNSPFCYAYSRGANPPFVTAEIGYEYKPGFKRTPVWEMPGGVKAWVAGMSDTMLADQFPSTAPIFIKDDMVEAFFMQRGYREGAIQMAVDMMEGADADTTSSILNAAFEQKFEACSPAWGHPCGYRQLCFGQVDDPLTQGFSWRTPHHALEMEQQAEESEGAE